jgi:membrane associated rhomboid family serine protease
MFVQPTAFALLVNTCAVATAGFLLERYVGSLTFLAVYLIGGVLAGVLNLWGHAVTVSGGAFGSVFALYGLLLASLAWSFRRAPVEQDETGGEAPTSLSIPPVALKRLVPAAVLFLLYSIANDGLSFVTEFAVLAAGFAGGLFITRHVDEGKPSPRLVGIPAAVGLVLAVVLAFPVRSIANVRPEMERVLEVEQRTAAAYQAAYTRYKKGRVTARAVADIIERTIIPELNDSETRLKALKRVPAEHQPLVDAAKSYVELRSESWRLRADGLRKAGVVPEQKDNEGDPSSNARYRMRAEALYRTNMATLGKAEAAEREALEALRRLDPSQIPTTD